VAGAVAAEDGAEGVFDATGAAATACAGGGTGG